MLASGGRLVIRNVASCVLQMVSPFDTVTVSGDAVGCTLKTGVLWFMWKKWPVVPESIIGCSVAVLINCFLGGEGTLKLIAD